MFSFDWCIERHAFRASIFLFYCIDMALMTFTGWTYLACMIDGISGSLKRYWRPRVWKGGGSFVYEYFTKRCLLLFCFVYI